MPARVPSERRIEPRAIEAKNNPAVPSSKTNG